MNSRLMDVIAMRGVGGPEVLHLTQPSGDASWHGAAWRRRVCYG